MWLHVLAAIGLAWYALVVLVISVGVIQLHRHYLKPTPKPISPSLPAPRVPHVTIIRPVRGIEPYLYECLASTFHQNYPPSKLTVYFCIASRADEAYPILEQLHADFCERFDFRIYVEEEDPFLYGEDGRRTHNLGPNPKIRNMSRAYREAKGDVMWIVDCNVWISAGVCGLMVDALCGYGPGGGRKYKFVHQLPLVVDVSSSFVSDGKHSNNKETGSPATPGLPSSYAGGLLDELFLSTSHAKFYTAISTAALAPCTVGKSNMFRRSHLAALTPSQPGIDFFSHNICEDHLIGDLLWRSPVPDSVRFATASSSFSNDKSNSTAAGGEEGQRTQQLHHQRWGNHALLLNPPCIQPLAHVSLSAYIARRARWLRVRKFTVPVATLVEPGTESLLASAIAAYALTTLPWFSSYVPRTWLAFGVLWTLGVAGWAVCDWWVWRLLQSWNPSDGDSDGDGEVPPVFVGSARRRGFAVWLAAWAGRELLAWPVWAWAVLGGTEVVWRGRRFWVGFDMRVHALDREQGEDKRVGMGKRKEL